MNHPFRHFHKVHRVFNSHAPLSSAYSISLLVCIALFRRHSSPSVREWAVRLPAHPPIRSCQQQMKPLNGKLKMICCPCCCSLSLFHTLIGPVHCVNWRLFKLLKLQGICKRVACASKRKQAYKCN